MDGGKLRATVANAVLAAAAALAWTPAGCAAGAAPAREYFASEEALAAAEAIRRRRPAALGRLIAGGLDVDHRGRDGMNLLKWALASGCPKCFEALLEAGASTEHFVAGEYTGKVDQTSLMPVMELAASIRDTRYLALALEHGGDPDAPDVYGTTTVIFAAIMTSRIENVRLLVGAGADLEARDGNRQGPLLAAVAYNNYEIAYYLLEQGADPSREDQWGYTVADTIDRYGDRGVSEDQYDWYLRFVEKLGHRD